MMHNQNLKEENIIVAEPDFSYSLAGWLLLAGLVIARKYEPDRVLTTGETIIVLFFLILGIASLVIAYGSKVTYSSKDKILAVTRLFIFTVEYNATEIDVSIGKRQPEGSKLIFRTKQGKHVAWIPDNWNGYDELRLCFFPMKYRVKRKTEKKVKL